VSDSELCVHFEVADLACALPARLVVRLAIAEEVELRPTPTTGEDPGLLGVARLGGEPFAAWDLGLLLGRPAQAVAWIALRWPGPAGPVAVALRTGRCTGVSMVTLAAALPPVLFSARGAAFGGVFAAPGAAAVDPGADLEGAGAAAPSPPPAARVGVLLEAERLLEARELTRSRALLEAR
jgi:hypothetical protein